jgi:hypothetical protein
MFAVAYVTFAAMALVAFVIGPAVHHRQRRGRRRAR